MGSKSAGGLKVKALTQTVRDVGSSPAQCSSFPAKFLKRKLITINSYKQFENTCLDMMVDH